MITKSQAEELRRLIGAHTAAQVTAARSGALISPHAIDAVTANCLNLLEFISSITEAAEDA
ncbi:hypothetical protein [Serratia nevei]|uniref:hypothetical protein n=1 Tax=Serratia nevei TaxID=2703794 RepID=UPI00313B8920